MQKVHKLLMLSLFSATTLLNAGCNRYVEEPIDPCADQAAQRAMQARAFSARPGFAPAPQFMRFNGAGPDGGCGNPDPGPDPGPPAPGPDPNPPAPGPDPGPPAPGPDPNPPAPGPTPPTPPAPPTPTPPGPTPTPAPTAKPTPAPTPTPTPAPTKAQLFFKAAASAGINFKDEKDLAGRLRAATNLYPVGFATGKFKTPEENIEHLFKVTQRSLGSKGPETPEEYAKDAIDLGVRTGGGRLGVEYYLDLKESKGYNQPLYILRYDSKSYNVVGIAKDPATIWTGPKQAYDAMSVRASGADDGYIFYYGGRLWQTLDW